MRAHLRGSPIGPRWPARRFILPGFMIGPLGRNPCRGPHDILANWCIISHAITSTPRKARCSFENRKSVPHHILLTPVELTVQGTKFNEIRVPTQVDVSISIQVPTQQVFV